MNHISLVLLYITFVYASAYSSEISYRFDWKIHVSQSVMESGHWLISVRRFTTALFLYRKDEYRFENVEYLVLVTLYFA